MHHAQHRLLFDVDDQQGMDEEAQRLAVAGWPQPLATAIGAGEVDLGVSCTASTRRPAAALMVRSAAVAMMASCVTLALSRKRCVATSPARSPPILRTISEPD
jgi:hypothetical protein